MQPVDFTTLAAIRADLQSHWLPARCEQVYQRDRYTLFIALRTLEKRGWLAISWHPQAARIHIASPPPKTPNTFTFSQQLKHQLAGLALTKIDLLSEWERGLDLQFARRPNEPALWHLYVEVMGKYSNVILTAADHQIVTAANQVSEQQSSVRPIQTSQPYVHPPAIRGKLPHINDKFEDWRARIALIPGPLKKMMVKSHSGVSSSVASQLIWAAGLNLQHQTTDLNEADWHQLFQAWKHWLNALETSRFSPAKIASDGYTVLANLFDKDFNRDALDEAALKVKPTTELQALIDDYYQHQFNQEEFRRLHHQLSQALKTKLKKLRQKAATFSQRLQQSDSAEEYRLKADLLMAHLHEWQVGMTEIELIDFETNQPVHLPLNPEKNAVQNAQAFYKQHQKLKRARTAVLPLLNEVKAEIDYLEQVEDSLLQVPAYQTETDLKSLTEIQAELIDQGYLRDTSNRQASSSVNTNRELAKRTKRRGNQQADAQLEAAEGFRRYQLPQGLELLVGRNNNQNEQLTFKQASDYDLWLHAQEIPGSHVLLRLDAGQVPADETLTLAASFAAYYSRARQSEQVPVVVTEPKYVYKPKGALPGMVIYKREQVLWGQPQQAKAYIQACETAQSSNSTK